MFTFASRSSSARSRAISSAAGATKWHGAHHSAQKSTMTGFSLASTSSSNVARVASITSAVMPPPWCGCAHPPPRVERTERERAGGTRFVEKLYRKEERAGGAEKSRRYALPVFRPLPREPDHPALEDEVLAWWREHRIFDQLREQNRGGLHWSFIDGPLRR